MKAIFITFLFININLFSQTNIVFEKCGVKKSLGSDYFYSAKSEDLKCISQNSEQQVLVYVFEWWCKPCNEKIDEIKTFASSNNLKLIILTIEKENSKDIKKDETILKDKYKIANAVVLSDSYGKNARKKYANFLKEIYNGKEPIEDLSKLIIYDKKGNVKYISNWQDGNNVLTEKIFTLLD